MKYFKQLLLLAVAFMLLVGCGSESSTEKQDDTVLATTYPMYWLCTNLLENTQGIQVEALITEQVSCLHDYTLTTTQMRLIEGADLVVMSGAGLEHFMESALDAVSTDKLVDSSVGIELIDDDPHIWLDPERYAQQAENVGAVLSEKYPEQANTIQENTLRFAQELRELKEAMNEKLQAASVETNIITFHDGFTYFADAFGLNILAAIEEEEGAEPSAAEIKEICTLVEEYNLKTIFVEINGSTAAAEIIAQETGVAYRPLSTIMGETEGGYQAAMEENIQQLLTEDEK